MSASAGALLVACNQSANQAAAPAANAIAPPPLASLPLSNAVTPDIAPAPLAANLPPAPPARTGHLADRSQTYAFLDRAYAMNSGFGDAPPDYTVDYGGGERPWIWRGDDGSTRIAERLGGGGYRYYYYEPNSTLPYLVRDPEQSYAYDNGVLVVVYDRQGRPMPPDELDRESEMAGRFEARAEAIREAADRGNREAVAEANWAERRREIAAEQDQWAADQQTDQDWRYYHEQHAQDDEDQWAAERYRRESEAARYDQAFNDQQAAALALAAAQAAQARAFGRPQGPPYGGPPQGQPYGGQPYGGQPYGGQPYAGQPPQGQQPGGHGFFGGAPQGPGQPAPQQAQGPAPQGPAPQGPAPGQGAAAQQAQLEAQRRAQMLAAQQARQQAAQQQATLEAQRRAQMIAAQQAQQQSAQQQAALEAQRRAQMIAAQQAQQQSAQQQAALEAQRRAQLLASQQAAQQAAQQQAALEAQRRAQMLAAQQAQQQAAAQKAAQDAQARAAHQAQIKAEMDAEAARIAQIKARQAEKAGASNAAAPH